MSGARISAAVIAIVLAIWTAGVCASPRWSQVIEAESGTTGDSSAHVVVLGDSSGGKAVQISADDEAERVDETPGALPSISSGRLDLPFVVPAAGSYVLWVRLQWHCVCSREIGFRASGRGLTTDYQKTGSSGHIITDSEPTGEWHWVRAGVLDLGAGQQSTTFVQRGHLAVIDAIAVSGDLAYEPPGRRGDDATAFVASPSPSWRADSRGFEFQRISERQWGSFRVFGALNVPGRGSEDVPPEVGIACCAQADGRGYFVWLKRLDDKTLDLSVECRGGERSKAFPVHKLVAETESWQALEIARVDGAIEIQLAGSCELRVQDRSLGDGQIWMVRKGAGNGGFTNLAVQEIRDYADVFANVSQWRGLLGTWRSLKGTKSQEAGGNYLGGSDSANLSLSPWTVGDAYSVTARLRPATGAAGIAFDVIDAKNYGVVAIDHGQSGQGNKATVSLIDCRDGVSAEFWSTPFDGPADQSHELQLRRVSDSLAFTLDGGAWHVLTRQTGGLERGVGVYAAPGAAAVFSSFGMHDYAQAPDMQFRFGLVQGPWALAHWRARKGTFVPAEHPDRLTASRTKETKEILLELRRRMSARLEVAATVARKPTQDRHGADRVGLSVPELSQPYLPGDPRIGIRLAVENPVRFYEASVDLAEMRDLVVTCDGRELIHRVLKVPDRQRREMTLFCRLRDHRVEAGLRDMDCAVSETADGPTEESRCTVSIFASDLAGGQSVDFAAVDVKGPRIEPDGKKER